MIGKMIRLERIMNRETNRAVIVPLDHGVSSGPIPGLISIRETVARVAEGGADAIVLHKGNVKAGHRGRGEDIGLIIHLSASTSISPDPNSKVLVCTIEEAIRLGADAVSIHVNLGADDEKDMLKDFGNIARECEYWNMPLLAMMYVRGRNIKNSNDPKLVKHAARVAGELGADIVKVSYTGDKESFREVVEGTHIPVVIAGGEKSESDEEVLKIIKDAVEVGGAGVSIGRNIFQHKNPIAMTKAVRAIVHDNVSLEEAIRIMKGE